MIGNEHELDRTVASAVVFHLHKRVKIAAVKGKELQYRPKAKHGLLFRGLKHTAGQVMWVHGVCVAQSARAAGLGCIIRPLGVCVCTPQKQSPSPLLRPGS
jgi:hypothetical protein